MAYSKVGQQRQRGWTVYASSRDRFRLSW